MSFLLLVSELHHVLHHMTCVVNTLYMSVSRVWVSRVRWLSGEGVELVIRRVPDRFPAVPKWRCVFGQGTSPYLLRGECPCTYCKSLWIRASAKWLNEMNVSNKHPVLHRLTPDSSISIPARGVTISWYWESWGAGRTRARAFCMIFPYSSDNQ